MFLNDVNKKDEIRNLAVQDLRNLGIKYRPKKPKQIQETKGRKVFKTALHALPMQTVTLESGQQLIVPKLVHELCSYIQTKVDTEGLFRKGGSKSRQNEIRLSLDAGCCLGEDHHEIDVASVLKTFFRELPEPLFPYSYHELFLHCMILPAKNLDAVLLSCLLLPCEHLNTLAYFMQFLNQVTQCSALNKMDAYNLAVVIGPTLLPVEEKLAPHATHRLTKICALFKLLVEKSSAIGVLPENIIERIALSCSSTSLAVDEDVVLRKKKKRRSGSLTRMFNGLKKIVGSKTGDEMPNPAAVTPDLLQTPCMTRSSKKRKLESGGFSIKKKREILNKLPHNSAFNTPYTPVRTPISINPNPKKKSPPNTCQKLPTNKMNLVKDKKSQWLLKSKTKTVNDETSSASSKATNGAKALLERRWSQVSQVANFRKKKKRNSCGASVQQNSQNLEAVTDTEINAADGTTRAESTSTSSEADYVRISKIEYEEIKNRVSAIERRISMELDPMQKLNAIENVQDAYEQTLVQAEPLSPTTDHLARRLSRDLKIRRSAEQKIIRSPSARKIGSLRRRSRELERQNAKLSRNQSWHVARVAILPRANLKRGKPNTVQTGLPQPSPGKNTEECAILDKKLNNFKANSFDLPLLKRSTRSSSVRGDSTSSSLYSSQSFSSTTNNSQKWVSAEGFFYNTRTPNGTNKESCRASLVRLRSQNAGMVLAKAKLFDGLIDSDSSQSKSTPDNLIPRVRSTKIGSLRNTERQSYRVRTLRAEDKRGANKSVSPRKRMCKSPNSMRQQRLHIAKTAHLVNILQEGNYVNKENSMNEQNVLGNVNKMQMTPLKDSNRVDATELLSKTASPKCTTPKSVPYIKKTFNLKSPKRLNRTPIGMERKATPLKVLTTPRQHY